jgi:hypothetical protein
MDGWKLGDCVRIGRNKIKESSIATADQNQPPLTTTTGPQEIQFGGFSQLLAVMAG